MQEDFLIDIRRSLDEGVYGKKSFVQQMKEKFKIKLLDPIGRPKKNQT